MISRRAFLATSGLSALAQAPQKQNVLLLIADDLGLHLGCYGDGQSRTPNLDRLAKEGVRFSNAFCTTASCSASRSVMLSGLQNHTSGHYGHAHAEHNFSYIAKVRPTSDLLKDSGYSSALIGKFHVNPVERFRWDFYKPVGGRNGQEVASLAKTFIKGATKPWYMHVGFTDPHRDGGGETFANKDYPNYKPEKFDPAKLRVPSFLPDNPETRADLAEYYQAVNRLDQNVGQILNVLRETGQYDNTLIIFLSDNGMPFPNAKTNCYEAGLHLPLIVRSPKLTKRGMVNHAMVNWCDLLPTILDWIGAKGPNYKLPGRSWLPILEEPNAAGWDEVHFSHTFHEVTNYYPIRGIRTRQFKYIRNLYPELSFPFASDLWAAPTWQSVVKAGEKAKVGGRPVGAYLHRAAEELYDIVKDPDELVNLAGSAEFAGTLKNLRDRSHRYRTETKDLWLVNDNYKMEK